MATYTHTASAVPSSIAWYNVSIGTAPVGTPTSTLLVHLNSDGTETRIIGTGFTYLGVTPIGGTVTEIDRTSSGGGTVYETVTGLSLDLVSLTGAPQDGNRSIFALIFQGADTFNGYAGDDFFVGGPGADSLVGGAGTNTVSYDNAHSLVQAFLDGSGSNFGDAGGDSYSGIQNLIGSDFNDLLVGNSGVNTLTGGAGLDTLIGGAGADILIGGAGADAAAYWNAGPGLIVDLAVPGNNTGEAAGDSYSSIEGLIGSSFADMLRGDANGNFFDGGAGIDTFDGRAGFDFVNYRSATAGVTADLANPSNNTGAAAGEVYISIEALSGTAFNDILRGDANGNVLIGEGGADVLDGGAGFDLASYQNATAGLIADLTTPGNNTGEAAGDSYFAIEGLSGGAFADTLRGDANNNNLMGNAGADILDGGAGSDFASYENSSTGLTVELGTPANNTGDAVGDVYISIEGIRGSAFNDILRGDANNNFFFGGLGADVLDGAAGFDLASYQLATAGLLVDLANPGNNTGEAAGDSYISIENLRGSAFGDTLRGDSNDNQLEGMTGADILEGGAGLDTASYQNATSGLTVDLASPGNNTGEAVGDSYLSIEGLRGSAFNDTLRGNGGDNQLEGGAGADVLDGALGIDTASYQNAATGLTASLAAPGINTGDAIGDSYISIENLRGGAFDDILFGNASNNVLSGGAGNDTLNGGSGTDTLIGGIGDDIYFVDNLSDVVTEGSGEGNDLINASVNYTLSANAEALVLIEGAGALAGLGNSAGNYLQGNSDNNALDGGAGGDLMVGGAGDDIYVVDNIGDAITENLSEGNDIVRASINYTIGANIESLILDGTTVSGDGNSTGNAIVGNAANNIIDGKGGADLMQGGAGDDIYFVDSAGDSVVENANEGNDIVHASINYTIGANIESLILDGSTVSGDGNSTGNAIIGNTANNIIDGKGGADLMQGGAGDDIYFVDNAGDSVIENLNEGNDIVHAMMDYTIGANIESLILDGTANLAGAGNSDGNAIVGNSGDNILDGRGGQDYLIGNAGNDTFAFKSGEAGGDLVADFAGNGGAVGDSFLFIGFGSVAQGATFTQVGATNAWQIHSGLDGHNEVITLQNSATVQASDFLFV